MTGDGEADQRVQVAESGGRIGEHIATLMADVGRAKEDIRGLRTDVDGLKRFVAWVFGIGTGLGAVAALLANGLKEWLKG
jgi:hypothetical protein